MSQTTERLDAGEFRIERADERALHAARLMRPFLETTSLVATLHRDDRRSAPLQAFRATELPQRINE